MRRLLIVFEIELCRYVGRTWTGDRLADSVFIALRRLPDLTRDELAYLLRARPSAIDAALDTLRGRRLALAREVWRITE